LAGTHNPSLTVGAPIRAATVRERFPNGSTNAFHDHGRRAFFDGGGEKIVPIVVGAA